MRLVCYSVNADIILEQFALIEVIYTTVRLLQAFAKIESRDEKPWSELLRMTCSSLNGCKVKLSK